MIRFFTLTLAVSAMFVSFSHTAQSAEGRHLVNSNAHMARSSTPEIIKAAEHKVSWQHMALRENTHHRTANKVSKGYNEASK